MWNWLKTLFLTPVYEQTARPKRTPAPAKNSQTFSASSQEESINSEEISSVYYGLLLGVHSHAESELNKVEVAANHQLDKMIRSRESRANLVPRLPAVIPQLMQSLRNDDTSGAELAKQIAKDTTLVGDVIRMANSPYYRTANSIKSLEQAVIILGQNGIRHILASAAFKPILNLRQGYFTRHASGYVWRQSEYCAFTAQCLAKKQGVDPFEAYLAGLIRDIGVMVALQAMDKVDKLSDAPRSYKFQRHFAQQSLRLSSLIASEWEFPSSVIAAIDEQAEIRDPAAMSPLGSILYPATLMSQLQLLIEEDRMDKDVASRFTCRVEGRLTDNCKSCFSNLQKYAA